MGTNGKINDILIPQVSKLPKSKDADSANRLTGKSAHENEFKNLLNEKIEAKSSKEEIQLSVHAAKRLKERNLNIDNNEFLKIKDAFTKLKAKGGQDSLVITDKAAYIVDVAKNKIVTAIDRESMAENVFTKIDSTVVV